MSVATGNVPLPQSDPKAVPEVVARLRSAFDSGRTRPLEWRREQLAALRTLVLDHEQEIAHALRQDLGKPSIEARITDVSFVAQEAALASKRLKRWTRPERVPTLAQHRPGRSWVVRDPLGVVLVIAPWNYPIQLIGAPLVGAIAGGNCTVIKPSELAPHCSRLMAELLPRYLDEACVAVVEGGVEETTALLDERFDHIFYTGNGTVARIVMQAAARNLTPVTLELGGKSPCIIDTTAKLEVAARRIVWGKYMNAGQTCTAPDYILVHDSRESELLELLTSTIREFFGDEPKASADFGRIINERHHARLMRLLEGADVVCGGEADVTGRYISPTVVRGVTADSPLMSEEIFGPLLPVLPVRDMGEAISFVSSRDKPLALYVFTEDRALEQQVLSETSSGGVCVNATLWHVGNPNLPFGGVGESGMGAYHGRDSFETFTHRKAVFRRPTWTDPKISYPPYTAFKEKILRRFL